MYSAKGGNEIVKDSTGPAKKCKESQTAGLPFRRACYTSRERADARGEADHDNEVEEEDRCDDPCEKLDKSEKIAHNCFRCLNGFDPKGRICNSQGLYMRGAARGKNPLQFRGRV